MVDIDKRYRVEKDGSVFYPVEKDTALLLWKHKTREAYDLCWLDEEGHSYEINDKSDIKHPKGEFYLYLGNMKSMTQDRGKMFETLEDVAEYIKEYKYIPFGIKSIVEHHGWRLAPTKKGMSLCIDDKKGHTLSYSISTGKLVME